ncbi:zinc-finger domain-containing protein [Pseudomonas sp. TH03]|nr:zinc-finger domain-containing protein [Pseudomonas sp. TH03]
MHPEIYLPVLQGTQSRCPYCKIRHPKLMQ